jgi:electron transport complex protein RnfG
MTMRAPAMFAILLLAAGTVSAQGLARDEALTAVFPGAAIERERVFLTDTQQADAAARSGDVVPSALVARYVATRGGRVIGRAYVDTHVVRTKRESLLIALNAAGSLQRVDVTAFLEPTEFKPSEAWLRQYVDRPLNDELTLDRAIRPIAGATLTTRAANKAIRRVLAIDAVLNEGEAGR